MSAESICEGADVRLQGDDGWKDNYVAAHKRANGRSAYLEQSGNGYLVRVPEGRETGIEYTRAQLEAMTAHLLRRPAHSGGSSEE